MNPLQIYIQIFLRAIREALVLLAEDVSKLFADLWTAFPNILTMADVLVRFFTGLTGRLLGAPFLALEGYMMDLLRAGKLHNKLIRVDDSVRVMFESYTAFVQTITMTRSSGLLEWFAQTVGAMWYRLWRRIVLLRHLFKINSEVEMIRFVLVILQRGVFFVRAALLILVPFIVLAWVGAQLLYVGLVLMLMDGSFQKKILSQDSIKIREKNRNRQARHNARRGPDFPAKKRTSAGTSSAREQTKGSATPLLTPQDPSTDDLRSDPLGQNFGIV